MPFKGILFKLIFEYKKEEMYVHIKDLNCISVLFLSDADYVTQSNARPRNKKTREESVNLGGMIKKSSFRQ